MSNEAEIEVHVDIAPDVDGSVDQRLLEQAVREAVRVAVSDSDGTPLAAIDPAEVSIRITNDEEMQALNRQYRAVDKPTDVLSFSFIEGGDGAVPERLPGFPVMLGEIVLSLPYALRQAAELGHSSDEELALLTVHGALQLLGYSHYTDEDAEHMEVLEKQALGALGFSEG